MNTWVIAMLFCVILVESLLLAHHWKRSSHRGKVIDRKNRERAKLLSEYGLCLDWLVAHAMNRRLEDYFSKMAYKRIAVYGVGCIGQVFLDYMERSNVDIVCCIDPCVERVYTKVPVIYPDTEYPPVDAVVICYAHEIDAIKDEISKKVQCPVVSLGEALFST